MTSRAWPWPLLGIAGAAVGLAPWAVQGLRLPLQNLGTADAGAPAPLVLLPFSQYQVSLLAALLVGGGLIAGLVARALPGTRSAMQRVLLLAGLLVAQAAALVQTATTTGDALQRRSESTLYLALLVGGSAAAILLGAGVLLLATARSRAAMVAGVALAAPLSSSWVGALLLPGPGWSAVTPWTSAVLLALPLVAPVGVGVAVASAGLRSAGRIAAAALAALSLWVGPALITALTSAVGTRAYARDPRAMLDAGGQVLVFALTSPEVVLPQLVVAAAVTALGLGIRAATRRRPAAAVRPDDAGGTG